MEAKNGTSSIEKRITHADKVQQISSRLEGSAARADQLNGSSLSALLFAKAPVDFLEGRTLDELVEITERSLGCLNQFAASGQVTVLGGTTTRDDEEVCWINTALGDRPFIINTITEFLRARGCTIQVLLHPIVVSPALRASLSYFEVGGLARNTLETTLNELRNALEQVVLMTEDFTSMLVRAETCARVLENSRFPAAAPLVERKEIADLLRWFTDGGFIFAAHLEWKAAEGERVHEQPTDPLGLGRNLAGLPDLRGEVLEDVARLLDQNQLLAITRLRTESQVHRRNRLTHIAVRELSPEGRLTAVHSFIGMLTSRGISQEASSVPLIRRKLQEIIEAESVIEGSYDYKNIVNIIDSMPKDEALRLSVGTLREIIHTIVGVLNRDETRVHMALDPERRGISLLTVMPRDRFNSAVRQRIQRAIEEAFGARPGSSEYHIGVTNRPLVRLYFYIPVADALPPSVNVERVRETIVRLSYGWRDTLAAAIHDSDHLDNSLEPVYGEAFPEHYQALNSSEDGVRDITHLEELSTERPVIIALAGEQSPTNRAFPVVVYSLEEITVSRALPVLEFGGFEVIEERSTGVTPRGRSRMHIHRFLVRPTHPTPLDPARFAEVVAPGLARVLDGSADNDPLNSLMLEAGLDLRALAALRTYCRLLWQIQKITTRRGIRRAVASVPHLATRLWRMFEIRFNPATGLPIPERTKLFHEELLTFREELRAVTDLTTDRIFRAMLTLLEHTLRTNFYSHGPTIALKIDSGKVDIMPQPRPLYEIFVSSPQVEGIHLRSARVARGGLRWSERPEDFRSEVLGLVKTQKVKNVVIVPSGAKGGFIVKKAPADPKDMPAAVENAYREFVRSLLTLTDNRVEDRLVPPAAVVSYDEPDPYLVVAADKGTAKFSDVANKLAVGEFNFWLGDAFASGGSNGYDHKIYAITAKGAWECAMRHFRDIGLDYTQPFSVVGIGDMSGDVFGNGLLCSDQMRLLAAFDHRHIFLDPNPDPSRSFAERKRLFDLPRSQWSDYDTKLISRGGGIFGRFTKEIHLSPEIRAALDIPADVPATVGGEQLIAHILKAKVDLLWNGGIGTYFKSTGESHADVSDGSNDPVRINSDEIRATVIAEGGNLGMTQKARVEFSLRGGRCNTDAIDNSGGVDLSDHEVNLKILFAALIRQGSLSLEERNTLLRQMAPDVVEAVLAHNRSHGLLLTLSADRSKRNIEYFQTLIRDLVKMGYVNRALESLPDEDELVERAQERTGLTRPELAICLAYVKMWVKDVLLASPLPKEKLLQPVLTDYFPAVLRERFGEAIVGHPLSANIVATEVANTLVDGLGITFVHRTAAAHNVPPLTVLTAALAAESILDTRALRRAAAALDDVARNKAFLELIRTIVAAQGDATVWLITSHGAGATLAELLGMYREAYRALTTGGAGFIGLTDRTAIEQEAERLRGLGIESTSALRLALLPRTISLLEMLWTAKQGGHTPDQVAGVFSRVMEELWVESLIRTSTAVEASNKWEQQVLGAALAEIRRSVSAVTVRLLAQGITTPEGVSSAVRAMSGHERLRASLDEVRQQGIQLAALSVIAGQFRALTTA